MSKFGNWLHAATRPTHNRLHRTSVQHTYTRTHSRTYIDSHIHTYTPVAHGNDLTALITAGHAVCVVHAVCS